MIFAMWRSACLAGGGEQGIESSGSWRRSPTCHSSWASTRRSRRHARRRTEARGPSRGEFDGTPNMTKVTTNARLSQTSPDTKAAPTCGNRTQCDAIRRNHAAWHADGEADGPADRRICLLTCGDAASGLTPATYSPAQVRRPGSRSRRVVNPPTFVGRSRRN